MSIDINEPLTDSDFRAVEAVRKEAEKTVALVTSKVIRTQADLTGSINVLAQINESKKAVKAKKEEITKPLNAALASVRALFAPIEAKLAEAESSFKGRVLEYKRRVEEEARKAQEKIIEKTVAGKVEQTAAIEKIEAVGERAEAKVEPIKTRKVKKVFVRNADLVPDAYWVIDDVLLRHDALNGVAIPGVEVVEEEIVVAGR
jgi:septal ring factor EnvC (AmiA/AmiB activator)